MNRKTLLCLSLSLFAAACQSTGRSSSNAEPRDAAKRAELFGAVSALEGRWQMVGAEPPAYIEFSTIANGTVVREVMFPGDKGEMVNMYTLDGNSLVMTHYCAGGNQPVMRAVNLTNNELVFEPVRVQDLEGPDAHYMSDMKLTFVDGDNVHESWKGMQSGAVTEMPVFMLQRVR